MADMWNAISQMFVSNVGATLGLVLLIMAALLAGAYFLWRRTGEATKPVLMVVLAVIALINVLMWTVPLDDGAAPIEKFNAAETQ